jgi:hypothetical protein
MDSGIRLQLAEMLVSSFFLENNEDSVFGRKLNPILSREGELFVSSCEYYGKNASHLYQNPPKPWRLVLYYCVTVFQYEYLEEREWQNSQ